MVAMSTLVSDCFTIGSTVACRTCYGEDIEGEVLAFDVQTKMLVLKSQPASGNASRHDVWMLNLALVSDVQIKKEAAAPPAPPAHLNIHRLNTRVRNEIESKKRVVSAMTACEHPEGQTLFLAIARVIEDVCWSGPNIRVYKDITIIPPYRVENIMGDPDSKPFHYICKFVERHNRDSGALQAPLPSSPHNHQ